MTLTHSCRIVLDSVIYEAPSLLRPLNKRLTETATSLYEWFETLRGLWRFSPAHGYEWRTYGTTRTAAEEGAHQASKQRRTYPAGVDISLSPSLHLPRRRTAQPGRTIRQRQTNVCG
ncbi:unnamed protein product [Vitrella brassicaformis CCMP3155]|uniref:Uncharacterized protein n=1 Tax=Vitrella brassicaformis (strain CCMP3155) TaxID=1169540 RepID=A0A0G4G4S9_VITBC|nr:unnamed protein product [Vitrella brassicaformis CCMP3155]|eukprot:CEM23396.1 unnamed protein product [Vitrella brassicaformis CCMP3155]